MMAWRRGLWDSGGDITSEMDEVGPIMALNLSLRLSG